MRRQDFPRAAALEVNAQVEAADTQRPQSYDYHHYRRGEPDLAASNEIDRCETLIQASEAPGPTFAGRRLNYGCVTHGFLRRSFLRPLTMPRSPAYRDVRAR